MRELFLVILALIGLWLLWFWFGGPERYEPNQGAFLKSPTVNQYYYDNTHNNSEF